MVTMTDIKKHIKKHYKGEDLSGIHLSIYFDGEDGGLEKFLNDDSANWYVDYSDAYENTICVYISRYVDADKKEVA